MKNTEIKEAELEQFSNNLKLKFKTHNDEIPIMKTLRNGTCLVGYLDASYKELKKQSEQCPWIATFEP